MLKNIEEAGSFNSEKQSIVYVQRTLVVQSNLSEGGWTQLEEQGGMFLSEKSSAAFSSHKQTLTSAPLQSLETLLLLAEECDIDYKTLMLSGGVVCVWEREQGGGELRQVLIMDDSSLYNELL